jgi:DDE superfamily endonuclease/Helix-turn-helix of DDE superfamily endonuclease
MDIHKLKQHPKVFKRMFGITPEQFDELLSKIEPRWQKAEAKRLRHPRKIKPGSGRKFKLTLEQNLAMLLLYTRAYVTHIFLGVLFNIDDSQVCRYFRKLRPLVETVFALPTKKMDLREEEIMQLIVDATEQHTERRHDGRSGYSGKKKAQTIKTQLVVNSQGAIIHISQSVPGQIHDKKLLDRSGVQLPDTAKRDLGYLGTNITIPLKASKLHPLTERQKLRNQRFSRKRIVVEHVFASLKAWHLLADRFRGALTNYQHYFRIVCGVRNLSRT